MRWKVHATMIKFSIPTGENDAIFSKIPQGLKFYDNNWYSNSHENSKNFGSYTRTIFYFNLIVILISRLRRGKMNGGHKFSEIKVQKLPVLLLVID